MEPKSDDLTTGGIFIGIIFWFICIFFLNHGLSCAETNSCGHGDLILNSIISVGMLAPSWLCASIASIFFKN